MRPNQQFLTDLSTFTEKILNGKLHFLYSEKLENKIEYDTKDPILYKPRSKSQKAEKLSW